MLTKDQILNSDDLNRETVEVPEWGGSVTLQEMTGSERDKFEQATYQKNGDNFEINFTDMRARLCALCIVDDKGKRLFNDADVRQLSQKSAKALDRIFAACQSLNGFTGDDVKELAKNSGATLTDDSTSD